jgi:catechol 2,3-dioxygenase-like lactoylglutathione lyase family enzyme
MAAARGASAGPIRPAKLAHFVVRTTPERFRPMADWYRNLLEAEVAFENAFSCFMTYDDEHHRVAILALPGLAERPLDAVGVDHLAFSYASLSDLVHTYERLASQGITPAMPIHHGPTLSLYYLDPDRNQVELQIDVFRSADEVAAFASSGAFARNPIGVRFDPALLAKRFHEGVPEPELIRPLEGPPPGPGEWPAH